MIVDCPNCQTKFNLPDEKVGPEGARVRCSVCKHVFTTEPAAKDDFPGFGDSGVESVWPVTDEEPGEAIKTEEPAAEEDRLAPKGGEEVFSSKDFESIDFGKEPRSDLSPGLGRKKLVLLGGLVLVLILGLATSAAYFIGFWPFAKAPATSAMESAQQTVPEAAKPAPPPDRTVEMVFDKVQPYYVPNEKLGNIFILQGKVVNGSNVTVGRVKFEACLFDASENIIVCRQFLGGPTASNFELSTLSQADIDARLSSVQEILLNNGTVKPGEDVPFMTAFINPPENLKSFAIKVIEVFEVAAPPAQSPASAPAKP